MSGADLILNRRLLGFFEPLLKLNKGEQAGVILNRAC